MKLLVTGSTGFVGNHLVEHLPGNPFLTVEGEPVDINEPDSLTEMLRAAGPDAVIHLAAQTFVPDSVVDPRGTFQTNVMGTLTLLCGLETVGFRGRMVFVGSSEVYGKVEAEAMPIAESHPLKPRNPYAASKAAAEALVYQWSQTADFEIVMTRPFNHAGPGQGENFVISQFAKQVAEIKKGLRPPVVTVGDIDVTRDFTDVRDVVRAYGLLLNEGIPGEVYNICSGTEHRISDLLDTLFELADVDAEVKKKSNRERPGEQRRMVGSPQKLRNQTGWIPGIPIKTTFSDALACWEKKIG